MHVVDDLVLQYMKSESLANKVVKTVNKLKQGKPSKTVWPRQGIFTASDDNNDATVLLRAFGMNAE
ncbi:hypothetical protein ACJX4I_001106 [Staphylococcus pseudintermedius]|uniref:hypothetical protein n=1 Tax=Staphylococcus pseudintermedius TaxID=283734 RepID=UPI0021579EB7|nr:hypothetical protein [Staphylococcus pseudintermedius]MDE9911263.1 hypothetical protein [Staphylococcus pseudintermedius]MDK4170313.1 hypothetical protein [Staphylococcus pseudintermedius]